MSGARAAAAIERALIRPGREARGGAGFWLFLGHLVTTFGIALSNALLLFVAIAAVARRPWQGPRRGVVADRRARLLLLPLAGYSAFFILSAVLSRGLATSLGELTTLFSLLTVPLALLLVRGEAQVRVVVGGLAVTAALLAAYGLFQFFFTEYGPLDRRIPGLFSHYMTFSGVLLIGLALITGRLASARGARSALNWVGLAVVGSALVLTLTRSAWLGALALAVAAIAVQRRRVAAVLAALLVVVGLSVAAAAPRLSPDWWERALSTVDIRNPSNHDRLSMLWAGGLMIRDHPLTGIGPAMVREWYPIYRHPDAVRPRVKHLHNTFVHMAASRGIPSLICYLWLMGAAAALAYSGCRREGGRDGPRADLHLGVLFALLALNVAGLFEANWRDTEIQRWVLFLLALPACLASKAEHAVEDVEEHAP